MTSPADFQIRNPKSETRKLWSVHPLVPKLCLGTRVKKLRFKSIHRPEAELLDLRSQAELGNEEECVSRSLDSCYNSSEQKHGVLIMAITIDAVFENGVFKPIRPLSMREHERVELTIVTKRNWVEETAGIMGFTGTHEEAEYF